MEEIYFNFQLKPAGNRWAQIDFWRQWREIIRDDPHWTPPYFPALIPLLHQSANYQPYALEALRRHEQSMPPQPGALSPMSAPITYQPVAATLLLTSLEQPQTAFLGLLHTVNNEAVLKQFMEKIAEESGVQRFLGPAGCLPALDYGALNSHWHEPVPLHVAYSPPFLSEVMATFMSPAGHSALFWIDVPAQPSPSVTSAPAHLEPLHLDTLAQEPDALMVAALADSPPGVPGREAAQALLAYLTHFPTYGWIARIGANPAGFVLLQPDLADRLRRAGGGRFPWGRAWFRRAQRRPVTRGRLLLGGVLPRFRRQGIGRQLWQAVLQTGREEGWTQIAIGPVGTNQPGHAFLLAQGAAPRQTFTLYSWSASVSHGLWW